MKKKLLCCIVATVTTLAAVLSLGNASGPVVGNAASTETVDEYLLENGFSQNFIEATGARRGLAAFYIFFNCY